MRIHALANALHLLHHLIPILQALPEDLRGEAIQDRQLTPAHVKLWSERDIVMVASYRDIAAARGRRVIYVEHGAGQSYVGARGEASRYYHGGDHPDNVVGYIGPRQSVIDAWGRPGFAAGAPICDPFELFSTERCVAITFHWNGAPPNMVGVPEAGTAWEHYVDRLADIVAEFRRNDWTVLGHHHPRFLAPVSVWNRLGVEVAPAEEVRRRAQLLVADNTSLMYEMMYLGRGVIALNAPWYRRDVEHGLRFWEHAPKVQVDDADELIDLIPSVASIETASALLCDWDVTQAVYGRAFSDGLDGLRAASWITPLAHRLGD